MCIRDRYPGRAFITDKCSDPVAAIRLLDMFYATEEDAVEGDVYKRQAAASVKVSASPNSSTPANAGTSMLAEK